MTTSAADGSRDPDREDDGLRILRYERNGAWALAAMAWTMAIFTSVLVLHLRATVERLRSEDSRCLCMPEMEVRR